MRDLSLDGQPATPLTKRARTGPTPSTTTPLARGSLKGTPSLAYTPQPKTALPSHLSRSLNGRNVPAIPATPSLDSPSSSSAIRFEDRKNALEVVETLNAHLPAIIGSASEAGSSRIALVSNVETKKYSYRYMFEKITERADGERVCWHCFATNFAVRSSGLYY